MKNSPIINRLEFRKNGKLDDVVTDGGAHFERLNKNAWFLNCIRADGTSFSVWIKGKITHFEDRK
jgi:hypothetical protein